MKRVSPTQSTNFRKEHHREMPKKECIKHTENNFNEMLAYELRLLDASYLKTMNILGGK